MIPLTGATGNVGSHVLPELVRRGHSVRPFDGDVTDPAAAVQGVTPSSTWPR